MILTTFKKKDQISNPIFLGLSCNYTRKRKNFEKNKKQLCHKAKNSENTVFFLNFTFYYFQIGRNALQ